MTLYNYILNQFSFGNIAAYVFIMSSLVWEVIDHLTNKNKHLYNELYYVDEFNICGQSLTLYNTKFNSKKYLPIFFLKYLNTFFLVKNSDEKQQECRQTVSELYDYFFKFYSTI